MARLSEAQVMDVLQRAFATGPTVHVDGWTSERGRLALAYAEEHGWCTARETRADQYTAINYTVTDAGRKALEEHHD